MFIEICKTLSVKVGVTKKFGRENCSLAFVKRCWLFLARWLFLGPGTLDIPGTLPIPGTLDIPGTLNI